MSYKITYYANDETIDSVEIQTEEHRMLIPYGYNTDKGWNMYEEENVSGNVKFTANPDTDCSFVKWIYHIGSIDAAAQYSYSAEFTYTGGSDIYISAVGKRNSGYKVTCYCKDESIKVTTVTYDGNNYYGIYGDNGLQEIDENNRGIVISGLSKLKSVKFTATPDDDCSFVKWVYHVGSPTASTLESEENPFTYSEYQDIFIAAVGKKNGGSSGGDIEGDWSYYKADDRGIVTINNAISASFGTLEKQAIVFPVTFANDGIAWIHSVSDTYRVKGYISKSLDFNGQTGEPLEYDYNGECDAWKWCDYKAKVIKGVKYYVWFRSETGSAVAGTSFGISMYLPKWSWDEATGTLASREEMRAAHSAVTKKLPVENFSHNVWNELCSRVKQILDYKTEDWNTDYLINYTETQIEKEPRELTAVKFNSLRNNIGIHYSTGIEEVKAGDCVYGSYFITLANCINGWIDTLL